MIILPLPVQLPQRFSSFLIFNSLNMIWNHTQPVKTRTNFKVYRLGARFRNGQYMRGVIRALFNELMTRDPKQYEVELKIMRDYIESKKFDTVKSTFFFASPFSNSFPTRPAI